VNIGELKAALAGMPDDRVITVYADEEAVGWYTHIESVTRPAVSWEEEVDGEFQNTAVINLGRSFDSRDDVLGYPND